MDEVWPVSRGRMIGLGSENNCRPTRVMSSRTGIRDEDGMFDLSEEGARRLALS